MFRFENCVGKRSLGRPGCKWEGNNRICVQIRLLVSEGSRHFSSGLSDNRVAVVQLETGLRTWVYLVSVKRADSDVYECEIEGGWRVQVAFVIQTAAAGWAWDR